MHKLLRFHPRLWIAVIVGDAVFFLLPAQWSLISRVLVSWNCGVALFLVLIYLWMTSLTAIVEPLATIRHVAGAERIWHFALATVTLIDSWLLLPTIFTTYYADMY